MAYTKYSLTPANNTATPPDGAPEGMLPSAVNDTMRDMMAQIRDCGDGIRDGTYTMTAPKITGGTITGAAFTGNTFTSPVISGGSINNTPIGASTANTGAFTTLSASGATTFSGATVVSGSLTANTFSSSGATITGGSINSTAIGGSTAAAGAFTTLSASGAFSANGGATLGDASGDALTINSSAVSIPNGLNFDSNTLVIDAANNTVGIGTSSPAQRLHVVGNITLNTGVAAGGNGFGISVYASDFPRLSFRNSTTGDTTADGLQMYMVGSDAIYNLLETGYQAWHTSNTERMRLDSSGNLGLGVTPSAWAGFTAMQFGGQAYVAGTSLGMGMTSNAYRDAGGFKYIATSGAALYAQASGNSHAWYVAPSGTAGTAISFTQAMTLDASGNLLVGITSARSNAGDVQVSKGISFPATQSAQSDANTLDDYEEGTFTPTIVGSTAAGTGTYTTQTGKYTKIGNVVYVQVAIVWTAHTGTGNLRTGGFPFTSGGGTTNAYGHFSAYVSNIGMTANYYMQPIQMITASTTAQFTQSPTGGGAAASVVMDTAGELYFAGFYFV